MLRKKRESQQEARGDRDPQNANSRRGNTGLQRHSPPNNAWAETEKFKTVKTASRPQRLLENTKL